MVVKKNHPQGAESSRHQWWTNKGPDPRDQDEEVLMELKHEKKIKKRATV